MRLYKKRYRSARENGANKNTQTRTAKKNINDFYLIAHEAEKLISLLLLVREKLLLENFPEDREHQSLQAVGDDLSL